MAEAPRPGTAFARRQRRKRRSEAQAGGGAPVVGEPCSDGDKPEFHPHHALSVPRSQLEVSGDGPVTTVMLRHVPCKYTQGSLLRELDEVGFQGKYDFFYLPMDRQNKTSVGYAFVNFVDASDAQHFMDTMTGYRFQRHPNSKVAAASPAHLQGLRRNAAHFSSRAILHARNVQSRPIVLQGDYRKDLGELASEFLQEGQQVEVPAVSPPSHEDAAPAAAVETVSERPPPPVPLEPHPKGRAPAPLGAGEAVAAPLGVLLGSPRSNVAFEAARQGFETALVGVLRRQHIDIQVSGPASRGRKARISWVDRAIGLLVEELQQMPPKGATGCWITEAFVGLVGTSGKGEKQLLAMAPASDAEGAEQRCWVADAFRSLVGKVAKSRFEMSEAEGASDTSSVPTTPRALNGPCGVGDALQRLQALGGWAWVAFA